MIRLTSKFWLSFEMCCNIMPMIFCLLVMTSFKSLFSSSNSFILCFRVVVSSVLILQSCSLLMVVSFFNDQSSSVKYDFIVIIFSHSFGSRNWNLAFREEFPIVRTRGVLFIVYSSHRSCRHWSIYWWDRFINNIIVTSVINMIFCNRWYYSLWGGRRGGGGV